MFVRTMRFDPDIEKVETDIILPSNSTYMLHFNETRKEDTTMLILCFKGSFQSLGLTTNTQVYTELFLPLRISRPDFRKLVREEVD